MTAFPMCCAPKKDQSRSAADWRPPKSGDQEGDGRPSYPRRSGRPTVQEERCVGTCDRGLKGVAHRRCVNSTFTQPVTVRAENISELIPAARKIEFESCK